MIFFGLRRRRLCGVSRVWHARCRCRCGVRRRRPGSGQQTAEPEAVGTRIRRCRRGILRLRPLHHGRNGSSFGEPRRFFPRPQAARAGPPPQARRRTPVGQSGAGPPEARVRRRRHPTASGARSPWLHRECFWQPSRAPNSGVPSGLGGESLSACANRDREAGSAIGSL